MLILSVDSRHVEQKSLLWLLFSTIPLDISNSVLLVHSFRLFNVEAGIGAIHTLFLNNLYSLFEPKMLGDSNIWSVVFLLQRMLQLSFRFPGHISIDFGTEIIIPCSNH